MMFVHECSRGVRLDVSARVGYLKVGSIVSGVDDSGVFERFKVVRLNRDWNFIVVGKIN